MTAAGGDDVTAEVLRNKSTAAFPQLKPRMGPGFYRCSVRDPKLQSVIDCQREQHRDLL